MPSRNLDPNNLNPEEDWIGNNAAFKCPLCGNTFIVSGMLHRNGRKCTNCGKSTGYCKGGKNSGGSATIEW
ncbi:hypothetical protein [Methanococcoides sp. LMO-2]|uniref:Small zinc finger protein HVO-2753-like zinc-binding pocket domain-containing protein n=1 Tax=Methanococcoides cohabitans TaxID=3136559 RepID=A0ABU9KVW2_9EURY